MLIIKKIELNPNPITKFYVVILLGFTVLYSINNYLEWTVIFIISFMYFLNNYFEDGIKNILFFGILFFIPNFTILLKFSIIFKILFSLLIVFRIFYIPYSAGKFLIKTSDVGSIVSSMDYLKIPNTISIPIAVMFRFFPSFIEEKNNIKMAMKIRGIKTKNPLKYIEYVLVPLLIISSNIADDISKAAETKCIANPIKKVRYTPIKLNFIDLIYFSSITIILFGGWACLK